MRNIVEQISNIEAAYNLERQGSGIELEFNRHQENNLDPQSIENVLREELRIVKAERDQAYAKIALLEKEILYNKDDRDDALLTTIYDRYNSDYPGRISLINQLQQWHKLGHHLNQDIYKNEDKEIQLQQIDLKTEMTEVFFPIIDIQQYQKADRNEDLEIVKIKEELIEGIVDVLIVLQSVLKEPSQKPKINEPQKIVLCGLVKRLLNQIPTRDPLKFNVLNSKDLPVKIAKLYQILGHMQDKKAKLENLGNQDPVLDGNKAFSIAKSIQELILFYENYKEDQRKLCEKESPFMEFDDMVEMFKQHSIDHDKDQKIPDSCLITDPGFCEDSNHI